MKFNIKKRFIFPLLAAVVLIFNSCAGLSLNIQMNKDGSGKLMMEYRISSVFNNLGALDGNEKFPVIPVGRADWERSLARIKGAKLSSYSVNEKGGETIYNITINYDNSDALLMILDPGRNGSSIDLKNNSGSFKYVINLNNSAVDLSGYDESLLALARGMFADNKFSISFSAPSDSSMAVTSGGGKSFSPPASAEIIKKGKNVSLSMGIMDFAQIQDSIEFNFNW